MEEISLNKSDINILSNTPEQPGTSNIENEQNQKKDQIKIKRLIIAIIIFILLVAIVTIYYLVIVKNKTNPTKLTNVTTTSPSVTLSTVSPTVCPSCTNVQNGNTMGTADGRSSFFFPNGSFNETVNLETLLTPGCSDPSGPTRRVGPNAYIGFVDKPNVISLKDFTITMKYGLSDLSHIDETTLAIYGCPNINVNPTYTEKLVSAIDTVNKTITAKSNNLEDYGVLGQLKCVNDSREPDDVYKIHGGQDITFDSITHDVFDNKNDVDWYFIDLKVGKRYTISTPNTAQGVIPIITLSSDGTDALQTNNNNPKEPLEVNQNLFHGYVQLKITPSGESKTGCDATYDLLVNEI